MANQGYKQPGVLAIIGGVVLFVLMIGLVCSLSTTVKTLGRTLLLLPSELGILDVPNAQSIMRLDLTSTPVIARFPQAGTYLVFTSNYDLLSISMQMESSAGSVWFHVSDAQTGQSSPVEYVTRGLMPYDTPLADGRPVMRFTIDKPGLYQLRFPTPPGASLFFVPDTTTGKEWLIWLIYLCEVGLIVGLPGWIYFRGWRRAADDLSAMRQAQREKADRFWEREEARREMEGSRNPDQRM
jgi:hypothetical protein